MPVWTTAGGTRCFVLGAGVKGGSVYANWPGLDLTAGAEADLSVTTDYRSVLYEVVKTQFPEVSLARCSRIRTRTRGSDGGNLTHAGTPTGPTRHQRSPTGPGNAGLVGLFPCTVTSGVTLGCARVLRAQSQEADDAHPLKDF